MADQTDQSGILYGAGLLSEFPLEEGCIYLNHGSFGLPANDVLDQAEAWRRRIEAQPARFLRDDIFPLLRETAGTLGQYVGGDGEDIVFIDNATTGVNAILRSLVLMPGDEVVTTSHVYPAVQRVLEFICERAAARIVHADIPFPATNRGEVIDNFTRKLNSRTRLVVLDHITSATAMILPIGEMIEECQDRDIPVLVDGAHAPGMIPLSLNTLGASWYVGNCHKWLGAPRGSAFIWTDPAHQSMLRPTTISHFISQGYTQAFDWPGSKDFAPWLTIPAAIDYREKMGGDAAIAAYCNGLVEQGLSVLQKAWGAERGAPPSMTAFFGDVALPLKTPPRVEAIDYLRRKIRDMSNIESEIRLHENRLWIRISAFIYNQLSDYEKLAETVLEIAAKE